MSKRSSLVPLLFESGKISSIPAGKAIKQSTSRLPENVSANLSQKEAQGIAAEARREMRMGETTTPLRDLLAQDVAVFPKTGRIIVNEHGVFVPRSRLGQNAEMRYEEKRLVDGSVRITILSHPRGGQSKSYRIVPPIDCTRELQWLKEHRQEYIGLWVALDGDRLVAHGTNGREVYDEARRLGVEVPALVKIDPSDEMPFGGW